ncbi:Embryonic polarity protein dorsal [Gryllus bimaculatus]|nr:Embryonic polarity protein dorsal [Gryllus bimaculatus]
MMMDVDMQLVGCDEAELRICDVLEVLQGEEVAEALVVSTPKPIVRIVEQPAPRALRFRYACEGRSAGSLPGVHSTPGARTVPEIEVLGLPDNIRAVALVSCVTRDAPYRPHPHAVVGGRGELGGIACHGGVCVAALNGSRLPLPHLGVQCVKRRDVEIALREREKLRIDPFQTGFDHRKNPSVIDLNSVRLCFQVFLEGEIKGKYTVPLDPVVSDPIYDKKATSELLICKMSDCSASVAGGREIILLCEKVAKDDIEVRFFEQDVEGNVCWEAAGDFTPAHVHRQVAICLRTPRYCRLDVSVPVSAFVQLRRPSDGACSVPLPFELTPLAPVRSSLPWLRRPSLVLSSSAASTSSVTEATSNGTSLCTLVPVVSSPTDIPSGLLTVH